MTGVVTAKDLVAITREFGWRITARCILACLRYLVTGKKTTFLSCL